MPIQLLIFYLRMEVIGQDNAIGHPPFFYRIPIMLCQCSHNGHVTSPVERCAWGNESKLIDRLLLSMDNPSAIISDIAVGSHFIGVRARDNGSACVGLASMLGAVPTNEERKMTADLIGKPLCEAAEELREPGAFSISLGRQP